MGRPQSDRDRLLEVLNVRGLDGRLSRNWYLLAAATVASTAGFALTVFHVLADRSKIFSPWPHTTLFVLGGLAVSVVLLVVLLSQQQRRIGEIRDAIGELELESVERNRHSRARLSALVDISRMLRSMTKPEKLFRNVMESCVELFGAQQASLMLVNPASGELVVRTTAGEGAARDVPYVSQKVGEGVAGWVAANRRPVLLGPGVPLSQYPGLDVNVSQMKASLTAPVMLRDELFGVITITNRDPGVRYDENDLHTLVVLAENIGTVIHRTEHIEWLKNILAGYRSENSGLPVS